MKLVKDYPIPSQRMGMLWTLSSVGDLTILEFGPEGTTRCMLESLEFFGCEPRAKIFTTMMDEAVVVMGDNSRLFNAIQEIDRRFSPEYIVVFDSSVAAVIGVDIIGLCMESQQHVNAKLIPIEGGGLIGDWTQGVEDGLTLLAGLADENAVPQKTFNILGLCADEFNQSAEMGEILRLIQGTFDVGINCVLSLDASIKSCMSLGSACLNIVLRREALGAAELLHKRFGIPYVYQRPYGLDGTFNWLQQIEEATGLNANTESLNQECAQLLELITDVRNRYQAGKVIIEGHPEIVKGLSRFITDELGLDAECYTNIPSSDYGIETVSPSEQHDLDYGNAALVMTDGLNLRNVDQEKGVQIGYPILDENKRSQPPLMGMVGAAYIASRLHDNYTNNYPDTTENKMSLLPDIQNYWDARSNGFSSSIQEELETPKGDWWRALFQKELGLSPLHILDCGCGPGFFSILLCQQGHQITAIDYSPKMLEKASSNLAQRDLSAKLLQMDAQNLEFPDASFDAIVSRNLLWNLDEPESGYREIFRVLKPGGKLILADGNYYLHLHDADYAEKHQERTLRMKEEEKGQSDHMKHNEDQVDFTIMDGIAKRQPLSAKRRPLWDCEQLFSLGVSAVSIEVNVPNGNLPASDIYDNQLVMTFVIVVRK